MRVKIKIATAMCAALLVTGVAQAAIYGPGIPTRAQYVAKAEKICQKSTLAGNRVTKGVGADLKKGHNKAAAKSLLKGTGLFRKSVTKVGKLTRPTPDAKLLGRWIKGLRVDVKFGGMLAAAISAKGAGGRTPKLAAQASKHGMKTNQIVNGFGFHFCLNGVK